jgi:hypothetical protein
VVKYVFSFSCGNIWQLELAILSPQRILIL